MGCFLALAACLPTKNSDEVAAGQGHYEQGNYRQAVATFRRTMATEKDAESRLQLNLGTALAMAALESGDETEEYRQILEQSANALEIAIQSTDRDVALWAGYNLGNTYLLQAEYKQAIAQYQGVLERIPDHEDAIYNLDLAKKLLAMQDTLDQGQNSPSKSADQRTAAETDRDRRNPAESKGAVTAAATTSPTPQQLGAEVIESDQEPASIVAEAAEFTPPTGISMALWTKLEALERRSRELHRANLYKKTRRSQRR